MTSAFTSKINSSLTYQLLLQQVDVIAEEICKNNSAIQGNDLLGGNAGIALLFCYLSKAYPERNFATLTEQYLEKLSNALENEVLQYSFSGGVAGIGFVFQHLNNISALKEQIDFDFTELDEFIDRGVDIDFRNSNWDPLHGMVGLGIYFLERNRTTGEKQFLEKIVDCLNKMKVSVNENDVWITAGFEKYSNDNYNFGMAHGLPGLLSFLAQVHQRGIKQNKIEEMLNSALPFLLQYEYSNDPVYCYPSFIDVQPNFEEEHSSRLAWCYGDLCMANALIHCGKALHNDVWMNKGIEVALKTTQRTFENSACADAPFCHGTAGLVHQYNRFYQFTGDEVFKNACNKWIEITLKEYYKPGKGAGGYFFRSYNEKEKIFEFKTEYGLLEGSAGIALVYLSLLFNIEPGWDQIFLTNIA